MMDSCVWEEIIADFKKARGYLCCPKRLHGEIWHRDEENGYYYLWKAYHFATAQPEKNNLWYARILYLMATEHRYKKWEGEILKKYLQPCIEAYEKANREEAKPYELEVAWAKSLYDEFSYIVQNATSDEAVEKAYSVVGGLPKDLDFSYHDSRVVSFYHEESTAKLTLDYYGTQVTLRFEDVSEIEVNLVDLDITYIRGAYCYQHYRSRNLIFDLECYRIHCERICIEEYKKKQESKGK